MANEFQHKSIGAELTQSEFEAVGGHILDSQAIGDLIYATSAIQLSRLGIGATGAVLTVTGGVPAWDTTWTPTGHLIPAADDSYDLGSAAAAWQDLFLEGDISLTDAGSISTAAGALTIGSAAAINITPTAGSAILLDGTISIDAGVVTGATSITSTAFAGALTGNVTGNASGTAATVTSGTQAAITTLANVTTVGALDAGSISTNFGVINNGASAITTTGLVSAGSLTVTGTTTLNGNLVLGDAAADTLAISATIQGATPLVFEGASAGDYETSFAITNPSADRTITFPDATLTVNAAANISGTTLASNVVTSSITTVGALGSGSIGTGFGIINNAAAITGTVITASSNFAGALTGEVTGNAATATALATTRAINGVNFDGSAAITVTAAAGTLSGDTLKSTVVTSSLTTVGTIGTGVWAATDVGVTHGGTGVSTLTDHGVVLGSGTGAVSVTAAGTSGQVLTSGGSGADPDWATPTVGDITGVTAGVGLSGGGTAGALTITLDLSELSTVTPADGDFFSTLDSDGANEQKTSTTALATLLAGTSLTASSSVISVDDDFLKNDANDTTSGIVTAAGFTLADAANVSIGVPLLAGTDHTTTGITAQMLAGGAIAAFDLVCIHSTTQEVVEADASAAATSRVIGIAPAAISDTATGTVLLQGFVRDDTWTWTTGGVLFLSETAGAMTHTAPTTDGAFVQAVGVALSPDVVYINPSIDVMEHA